MEYRVEHRCGVTAMPAFLYGRVLLLGLGEGKTVARVLRFQGVTEVVSVEIDPKVIAAFGRPDPRHTIVEGEAHAYLRAHADEFNFICQDLPDAVYRDNWLKTDGWQIPLVAVEEA